MTSTQYATAFGVALCTGFTALMYTTVPAYHNMVVWSWGLVGINLEAWVGF